MSVLTLHVEFVLLQQKSLIIPCMNHAQAHYDQTYFIHINTFYNICIIVTKFFLKYMQWMGNTVGHPYYYGPEIHSNEFQLLAEANFCDQKSKNFVYRPSL